MGSKCVSRMPVHDSVLIRFSMWNLLSKYLKIFVFLPNDTSSNVSGMAYYLGWLDSGPNNIGQLKAESIFVPSKSVAPS